MHAKRSLTCTSETTETYRTGCSKRPSSKAAASEEARRTLQYVEPLSDARTPLEDFFSILLELFGSWNRRVVWMLFCAVLLFFIPPVASAKSKVPRAPRPEPELKILDLNVSPNPYTVSSGSLQFSALVQLPKELNGATLLEVSSFITSPSKNSLRFLTARKPLEPHAASTDGAAPPRIAVLLTWDGLDQKKIPAGAGLYNFEVRTKLLANGEKGPRTQMVSWPKRGTVEVK